MKIEELERKLHSIKDSDQYFVDFISRFSEYFGVVDGVSDYLSRHPDATSSDVITESHRLVYGD